MTQTRPPIQTPPGAPPGATARRPNRMPAGTALAVLTGALLLGLLLNATDILRTAERQEAGWVRTVGVAVMEPIDAVSRTLFLDRPRRLIDAATGRREPEAEPETAAPADPATTSTTATTTGAETTTTTTGARREVSAAEPLRLFIGGDSMVGQFGPMLELAAEDTGVVEAEVRYEFESGLTRPDFLDWPTVLREVADTVDPDAIVLFFGGNDAQDIRIDGRWEPFGTDAWQEEYRHRVAVLMTELQNDGRDVYWIGMPIPSSSSLADRYLIMNEIYRSEAGERPLVTYVESWDVFTGPDGEYSEYLPDADGDVVDMRLNDGIHLTTDGGRLLAAEVLAVIGANWDLPTG